MNIWSHLIAKIGFGTAENGPFEVWVANQPPTHLGQKTIYGWRLPCELGLVADDVASAEPAHVAELGLGWLATDGAEEGSTAMFGQTLEGAVLGGGGSRLYRSQILQVSMRFKALAEIYTMHSFAQL